MRARGARKGPAGESRGVVSGTRSTKGVYNVTRVRQKSSEREGKRLAYWPQDRGMKGHESFFKNANVKFPFVASQLGTLDWNTGTLFNLVCMF